MSKFLRCFIYICFLLLSTTVFSNPIFVCSAENFYGNVAKMIGGKYVKVSSIISNPGADPHLFSISPKNAIEVTKAQIIIYNGAGYDPWMTQLLSSQPGNNKLAVIDVADLVGIEKGNNPHIWYKPETFQILAKFLAEKFSAIQPGNKTYFEDNLKSFNTKYQAVFNLINTIKSKHSGISVIATEPIFSYMSGALGFDMKGKKFQQVIMNGSEPSPKMTAEFINEIKNKKVKILFYNSQVTSSTTKNILNLAQQNNIAVVGVPETMPNNNNVIDWLISVLKEIENTLNPKQQ